MVLVELKGQDSQSLNSKRTVHLLNVLPMCRRYTEDGYETYIGGLL